jgi:hypothetical protein
VATRSSSSVTACGFTLVAQIVQSPKMPNREFAPADPPGLAGRHGGLDRRRRAVDRDALDGIDANAWAMRGRHFGWVALTAVVAMAVAGY